MLERILTVGKNYRFADSITKNIPNQKETETITSLLHSLKKIQSDLLLYRVSG